MYASMNLSRDELSRQMVKILRSGVLRRQDSEGFVRLRTLASYLASQGMYAAESDLLAVVAESTRSDGCFYFVRQMKGIRLFIAAIPPRRQQRTTATSLPDAADAESDSDAWGDALKQTQLLQQSVPATAPAHAAHAADAVDGTAALSTEEQMDQSAVDGTAALSTEEQMDQMRQHKLFFKLQRQIDLEQLRKHDDLQQDILQSVVSGGNSNSNIRCCCSSSTC